MIGALKYKRSRDVTTSISGTICHL